MRICVVPARGGSKRIPRKNKRDFHGKPVLARTIEKAFESHLFDQVVVSTDDDEIAAIARDHGASVPFIRPAELAGDHAPTRPVINHAISEIERVSGDVDYVCCLYATAVFVQVEDLHAGYDALQIDRDVSFAFSAVAYPHPIQRAFTQDERGRIVMLYPEHQDTRSQDLPVSYHDAGQFYWGRRQSFIDNEEMFGPKSVIIPVPAFRAVDIDTPDDWERALVLHSLLESPSWRGE
ncbi:MAG: pseudaminic acid cytidylyltransferase [Pseudomonadota bacterium]